MLVAIGFVAGFAFIILGGCAQQRSPMTWMPNSPAKAKWTSLDPLGTNETPLALKVKARDGTNYLGVYMGMIAEWDGQTKHYDAQNNRMYGDFPQGVMMFSATSGELLKWIPYEDFKSIFVDRSKPEYANP